MSNPPDSDRPHWPADHMPVGIPEIAELLGVERPTVDKWLTRGLLPERDYPVPVGGRRPWKAGTIYRWAQKTGREPDGPAHFQYISEPNGNITVYALDADGDWERIASFVETNDDGERTAFPAIALRQGAKDPELAAYNLMKRWEDACSQWRHDHPDDPPVLPAHLMSRTLDRSAPRRRGVR
jgi:predicted DNA-binding transcriptional regulator AlpA